MYRSQVKYLLAFYDSKSNPFSLLSHPLRVLGTRRPFILDLDLHPYTSWYVFAF